MNPTILRTVRRALAPAATGAVLAASLLVSGCGKDADVGA